MTGHRTLIEVGPVAIRRLCCGGADTDPETGAALLDGVDDPVVLLDETPVPVADRLGESVGSLRCGRSNAVTLVHPSWWSAARVERVLTAVRARTGEVTAALRTQLLAAELDDTDAGVIVEIAARLVAVTAAATVAEPRWGAPEEVADAVAGRIAAATAGRPAAVLIDAPDGIGGASALATLIAERLSVRAPGTGVRVLDGLRLTRPEPVGTETIRSRRPSRAGRAGVTAVRAAAVIAAVALAVTGYPVPDRLPTHRDDPADAQPTVLLVEGRVALRVPARWPVRRVTGGPGSARVEVVSPVDPRTVLHLTQSAVPGETLADTAESLRRALQVARDDGPAGVFVDFEPDGAAAGRPAVTYRELRGGRHIAWAVFVDRGVRISVGCQSPPDGAEAIRPACAQAIGSAHAVH